MSLAPGPGLSIIRDLPSIRRDPLRRMLDYHREHGDLVRLGTGALTVHLLGHPDHADQVLRRRHASYDRQTRSAEAVRMVTGQSLLTNDGDEWRSHRLLMQPAFNHDALQPIAAIIEEETSKRIERWLALRGETIDFAAEMTHLTCSIFARAFFGTDLEDHALAIERLVPVILEETYARSTAVLPWHRYVKRARDRRFDRARSALRAIVDEIAAQNPDTPLWRSIAPVLDDESLRNETLALLLAGHETTANALAWTFAMLATHEEIAQGIRDGDSALTTAAFQEATRLYPAIWIVERRAIEDDEIDGFAIPADSIIYVSPYVLHRHPDFWTDAERYDPSRFLGNVDRNRAYLPYGAGPHHCIGAHLAMLEARTIVRTVLQRCSIRLADGARLEPQAWITLRPRHGVPMVVTGGPR